MFVCICNGVTERQVREAIAGGASSLEALHSELGVASQCGSCSEHAQRLIHELQLQRVDEGLFYALA